MTGPRSAPSFAGLVRIPCLFGERLHLFDTTDWARDLSWEQVQSLAGYLEAFEAKKGNKVFRQGDQDVYLCLLVKGRIEIVREDANQAPQVLATIESGKAFGEMSLIDGEPRSASAVAAEDSTVLVITADDFYRLIDEHPELGVALLLTLAKLMSQRLRRTSGMLVDFLES